MELNRFLRYEELAEALAELARQYPELVTVESYGTSFEGRALLLATVTDVSTGAHDSKPAHWVDANIHATEVTSGVAALSLLQHLVTAGERADEVAVEALRTRTFYVAPRVNPDGVEAALADSPTYRRSSMRPWPYRDAHQWPGLVEHDVDGDGRVLTMRIADANGGWVAHEDDARVMVPVPADGVVPAGVQRYRLLAEGTIRDFDGFTVPTPRPPQGLDMNRNFPAGWGTGVLGSGDHPLSEPEIDSLIRAIVARPNICGYNAYHTSGGVLLRPSSTQADSALPSTDVWTWKELGRRGTELTGYPVHSVFEDFTWDKTETMSGASDDWAYEHLGVFSWTTEFWDAVHAATGKRSSTDIWYVGLSPAEELAIAKWSDAHGEYYLPWRPFEHPQLGPVEIGGADWFRLLSNPPRALLAAEVAPHADFAVHQALAAPCIEILRAEATSLGDDLWRVDVGIANTGWLPTQISARAAREKLVLPLTAELRLPDGASIERGPNRVTLGQLSGRSALRLDGGARNDGTADRVLTSWIVRAASIEGLVAIASHPRAGTKQRAVITAQ
ncbi:M14 family metallopeptidase [Kribbella koreensis]|uniref:M14 family metallopeptidase n=1 Tax=Kribbella koreensis TaxID=57909 RepID=A0ABN1PSM7_9ACTN